MRKRIASAIYALLTVAAVGACAPIVAPVLEAEVCDDTATPDCAPARDVKVIDE